MDQKAARESFALETKIGELESDSKELDLVLETLAKTESSRKCYRMVGGVLIQRTVAEVTEALQQQKEQLRSAIENLKASSMHSGGPTAPGAATAAATS